MAHNPPSPMVSISDESKPQLYEAEAKVIIPIIDEDVVSSDGDDALKLAGTHAHSFDEKYYARVRRKVVSHLKRKQTSPPEGRNTTDIYPLGSSRHASSRLHLLHAVLRQKYPLVC